MQVYKAPLNDMKFLFRDFLNAGDLDLVLQNNDFAISDLDLILDEAAKFCEEQLLPINQTGDSEGCTLESGKSPLRPALKRLTRILSEMDGRGLP